LARDGWWLDAPPPDKVDDAQATPSRLPRWAGLLSLVALADWLFWDHRPGVSLAVFAGAIFAVANAEIRPRRALWRPTLLLLLSAAPVIDHVQPLSVIFLALGLAAALIWTRRFEMSPSEMAGGTLAFMYRLPSRWLSPLSPRNGLIVRALRSRDERYLPQRPLRDWAFPLAGGLVLAALMMQANPVLARLLSLDLDLWTMFSRALFWIGMALFIAPFLARDLPEPVRLGGARSLPMAWPGLNPASVLRALVLFNAVVGVQTATDVSILTFGAALPEGMSMAEYAHRGAYPLLATALLAGAFALAARPFLGEHRAIRPLLLLWLLQNMVLCGAAMLRLEHYIEAFGLTYLRLYALIWMGLVAAGLGLVAVQVLRARPNLWLATRCSALGLATLYVCSFLNSAQIIAAQNLARPSFDANYICNLGPMAHGAFRAAVAARPDLSIERQHNCAIHFQPTVENWRDWGFRSWQVRRYAAAMSRAELRE
jgi:hypothetical protein